MIKEIISENDKDTKGGKVKEVSVAEKVRNKATKIRRQERLVEES